MVPKGAKKPAPAEEVKELLSQHQVLVLLNGTADTPTTPESTELVNLLKRNGVKFVALDLNKRTDLAPIFT